MKETDCLGLPYPECAPPLVKDLSDIGQFYDLAIATDTAVQVLADAVVERLRSPDAVVMTGVVVTAGNDVIQPYGATEFDNAGMADTAAGGFFAQEDGEYLLTGFVEADAASVASIGLRVQPLVNGDVVSGRWGPGKPANGLGGTLEQIAWMETLFLRTGDFVNTMTHHTTSSATVVTYVARLSALLVMSND